MLAFCVCFSVTYVCPFAGNPYLSFIKTTILQGLKFKQSVLESYYISAATQVHAHLLCTKVTKILNNEQLNSHNTKSTIRFMGESLCSSVIFYKREQLLWLLDTDAFQNKVNLPKWGKLWKDRICSSRIEFAPREGNSFS